MSRSLRLLVIGIVHLCGAGGLAADPMPDPAISAPYLDVFVFAGPGDSHRELTVLQADEEVRIIERNHTGNWVRIQKTRADGRVLVDGWVLSGYLRLDENLRFSQVPVNREAPESDRIKQQYLVIAQLYEVPVMPPVSEAMRAVYLRGQWLGNHSNVITKVGDSVAANDLYLTPMSRGDHELGAYDYLAETINYFGPSLVEPSIAARIGMTTYTVFNPLWADKTRCRPNESPLACEYRLKKPSIAVILFGGNDVRHMMDADFARQMRRLVEESLAAGVIPVLSTFSCDPAEPLWWQSINFNLRLAEIAQEYEVPLINLWSAARILPDYGLDQDGVHMKNSGWDHIKFTRGNEAYYGTTLQNLLTIRMLDELRLTLNME
jgi:hypothetical protein